MHKTWAQPFSHVLFSFFVFLVLVCRYFLFCGLGFRGILCPRRSQDALLEHIVATKPKIRFHIVAIRWTQKQAITCGRRAAKPIDLYVYIYMYIIYKYMTHASGWTPLVKIPTPRACMLVDKCSFRPSIHFGGICCRQIDLFALVRSSSVF